MPTLFSENYPALQALFSRKASIQVIEHNDTQPLQDNLEQMSSLRVMAAYNKQYLFASVDPDEANAALSLSNCQAYHATAQVTGDWLTATGIALKQAVDLGIKAHNLALAGLSDSLSAESRASFANEIDGILEQALQAGNSRHKGDYIFAGFITNMQPFTLSPGNPDTVLYNGDSGLMQRSLGAGQSVTANVPGDEAFTELFEGLINARDALLAADLDRAKLSTAVDALESAIHTFAGQHSACGVRGQQVQTAISQAEETQLALKSLISKKEDVNMVEALTDLRNQETTYRAVLEVGRRTLDTLNLFDLLR